MGNRSLEYRVRSNGESLTARVVENALSTLEIVWENQRGECHYSRIKEGKEIRKWGLYKFKSHWETADFVAGYLDAYRRLGPKLLEQLPEEWKAILEKRLSPHPNP